MTILVVALIVLQADPQEGPDEGGYRLQRTEERIPSAAPPPGPLGVRGHSLFQIATIDFIPEAPKILQAGEVELGVATTWINVFNYDEEHYRIDGEFLRSSFTLWYGASDVVQFGVTVPVEYIGGGMMDGMIEGFHELAGLGDAGRDDFDRDEFHVVVGDESRESDAGAYFGDVTLTTQVRVVEMDEWSPGIVVGWKVKLPTASPNDFYDTNGIGFGVTMAAFYEVAGLHFYAGAGAAYVGNTEVIGEPLEQVQVSFLASVETRVAEGMTAVLQMLAQSPIAEDFHEFSDWTMELSGGLKFRISRTLVMEWAVIENLVRFDNSPDFGVHMAVTFRP